MLDSLITSKTRIKLLLKFFANPETTAYLRSLAEEFDESTNSVRVELNRLADAGMLVSRDEGRTKVYQANSHHPLFCEVQSMVRKYMGIDRLSEIIIEKVTSLGNIEKAYLVGDYANGIDSGVIDIAIIGDVDQTAVDNVINICTTITKRIIQICIYHREELFDVNQKKVLLWQQDKTSIITGAL